MAFKFGPASMRGVTAWGQKELADRAIAEQRAREEADMRLRSQLALENEKNLAEQKYNFEAAHGLIEKPRDPIADFRARLEIEKELNPPQPVGQPIIEDIGGGLYKITDSVTGKYEIRTKPKAGRGGGGSGGGGGYSGGYTTTGEPTRKPRPGYEWAASITANGKTTFREVPIAAQKGAVTESQAVAAWEKRRAQAIENGEDPAKAWVTFPKQYKKFFGKKGGATKPPTPEDSARVVDVASKALQIATDAKAQGMTLAQLKERARGKVTEDEMKAIENAWKSINTTTPEYDLNIPKGMIYGVGAEDYKPQQGNQFGKKTKETKKKPPAITYSIPPPTSKWGK